MTVPMIIDKVENYEHRIGVVNKRLAGAFFRTLGDSLYPETISEGTQILDSARIHIQADTTLSGNQLRKKELQLERLVDACLKPEQMIYWFMQYKVF